jgi:toxin ParE1/3/4
MTRRIIKSDLALKDLEEQAEYIRLRSPKAALRFLDAAEALFRQLASMPGIGEPFETANPLFQDLRCFPIPKFPSQIVYYKPLRDGIVVIRVLHGARDVDRIFGQEDAPEDESK